MICELVMKQTSENESRSTLLQNHSATGVEIEDIERETESAWKAEKEVRERNDGDGRRWNGPHEFSGGGSEQTMEERTALVEIPSGPRKLAANISVSEFSEHVVFVIQGFLPVWTLLSA